jgi:hypothetical protein
VPFAGTSYDTSYVVAERTGGYLCEHLGMYTVVPCPGDYAHRQRAAAPTSAACGAAGSAVVGHPSSQPATVRLRVSGMFVRVSASGVEAEPES